MQAAIAANPGEIFLTVIGEVGDNIGRGYSRIGGSRFLDAQGPLQYHTDISHARGTFEFDPVSGEWQLITLFPEPDL